MKISHISPVSLASQQVLSASAKSSISARLWSTKSNNRLREAPLISSISLPNDVSRALHVPFFNFVYFNRAEILGFAEADSLSWTARSSSGKSSRRHYPYCHHYPWPRSHRQTLRGLLSAKISVFNFQCLTFCCHFNLLWEKHDHA